VIPRPLIVLLTGDSDLVATCIAPDNRSIGMAWGPQTISSLAQALLDAGFDKDQVLAIYRYGRCELMRCLR